MIGANGKPGFIFLVDQWFFIHYVLLIALKTATKTQSPVVKFIITQAFENGCDYEKVLPGLMFISLVLLWYQLVTRKMYDLFSKVTLYNRLITLFRS